jgi:tRNA modification GTPase
MMKLSGWDDTIIALATPPGIGAIGVIRLSGNKAISIVNQLFHSKDLSQQKTHTIHVGFLKQDERILDEVTISLYRGPRSYTAEDVVEIGCHGSPYVQQEIMNACMALGCRLAKPGEFTQRAFLHGKLDLTQAEAVADLISSGTQASHKTAINNIRGGFSKSLSQLRERLLAFSALIELELDFSQEDVTFADRGQLLQLVAEARSQADILIKSFQLGNVIRNGVSVAIIGKPNAGKSTLLNALLNEDRAIVSEIPGTTRDTIEEVINIDGILFRLIDTAGIRQHTTDVIEGFGIEKSLKKMKEADLVMYLFDVNEMESSEVLHVADEFKSQSIRYLLVGNKLDQVNGQDIRKKFSGNEGVVLMAAKTGLHLDVVKERMIDLVLQDKNISENVIVTNARHYHALLEVSKALTDVEDGIQQNIPGDLLSLEIRRALHFLGEITGEITNEDQLDYIFSKFCIGK